MQKARYWVHNIIFGPYRYALKVYTLTYYCNISWILGYSKLVAFCLRNSRTSLPSPLIFLECRRIFSNAFLRSQSRVPTVSECTHAVSTVSHRSNMCVPVRIESSIAVSIRILVMFFVNGLRYYCLFWELGISPGLFWKYNHHRSV